MFSFLNFQHRSLKLFTMLALTAVAFILLYFVFFPVTVIPPKHPIKPTTIYIADYGWHSRLILPTGNGKLIEYAFGEWNYFALNKHDWVTGLAALLLPSQGTLGRRKFDNIIELQQMIERGGYGLLNLEVVGARVTSLLTSLEERFNRHIDTRVENPLVGLTLVQDQQKYTLLHNSNHELVLWLKELNCGVEGFVIWANFQVRKQANQSGKIVSYVHQF